MKINEAETISQYNEKGYIHLKNFFSEQEIEDFKKNFFLDKYKNNEVGGSYELSVDDTFGYLLKDQRLSKVLNLIYDNQCVYFGESGLSGNYVENKILKRWMHTDTRGNTKNPYGRTYYDPSKKNYPLCAVFVYLEDYTKFSGSIKIVEGSHKKFLPTIGNFLKVFFNISKNYKFDGKYSLKAIPFFNFFKTKNIYTKPGDLFIFNMALHHSANSCRLKIFPRISLPVFLEIFLDKYFPFLFEKNSKYRRIISLIFGKQSEELENYIRSRVQYINYKFISNSRFFNNENFRYKIINNGFKINLNLKKYFEELKGTNLNDL